MFSSLEGKPGLSDDREEKTKSRVFPVLFSLKDTPRSLSKEFERDTFELLGGFNTFGLAKLITCIVMCKAYGYEPTLNVLRGFLNLGVGGDWLTLSKREIAFRNFVVAGNDKDISFITKNPNEGSFVVGSPSAYVNNNDVDVPLKGKVVASETLKVFDDEEDIHGFPNTKELSNALDCHILVEQVTYPSWTGFLNNMSLEKLCDLHEKSYTRQAMMDNYYNGRVHEELKVKCDSVLVDLENNHLVHDLRDKIKSLEGQLEVHKSEYGRLLLEEKKWV
ncbi:hypothetical protein Tco_0752917, partial [Tanacetum coccineum]